MAKCWLLLLFLALSAFLLPAACATAAACHPDDLRVLRDFAGNLSAAGSGGVLLRAAWSGGGSCCGWEGVGCDGASGRVTALRLPGRGLAGPIPGASLAGLARLEELDLSHNSLHNISGALTVLRGCENLTTLILTKNFGSEELPGDCIGGFKSLEVLALGDCALRGTVPEWLSQCKKMEVLDLSWNQLVGTIPSWIGELDHLIYLDLSNNSLVGEAPKSFTRLKSLTTARRSLGMAFPNKLSNVITGSNNKVISGSDNVVSGNSNTVIFGSNNIVSGDNNAVSGTNNVVSGNHHIISGNHHVITGNNHAVSASDNTVSGSHNAVSGNHDVVSGSNNIVSGNHDVVSGSNHVVSENNKVVA